MQSTLLEQDGRATQTKRCPFCAEQIQAEAIKCRYCGEFLGKVPGRSTVSPGSLAPKPPQWYFASSTLVAALLCLGPLALPLAWVNPRYKVITKLLITLAVITLTMILCQAAISTYRDLVAQLKDLGL